MARYFLTRLKIEGFRGINNEANPLEIRFKTDSVNSIFAGNGIGKSSIFEAIYYAIHGTIPKLDSLQAQERPQDYYCNNFHSQTLAVIDLNFEPDVGNDPVDIRVERDSSGNRTVSSPSGYANPIEFLHSLKEEFALLDYRTFSRFIEDSSLERGRTFSALLGLSKYSDRRQALQAASETRTLNSDLDIKVLESKIEVAKREAQEALAILLSSYEKIIGEPLIDINLLNDYALEVASALGNVKILKNYFEGKSLADIDFDEVKSHIRAAEGGGKRLELENTIEVITKLNSLSVHDLNTVKTDQQLIKNLVGERNTLLSATRGDLFKRLYDTANKLFSEGTWDEDQRCPLCEKDLDSSISAHINSQLSQYNAAATKVTEINFAWKNSAWRQFLSDHEEAAPVAIDPQNRQFPSLENKFSTSNITNDEISAAINWTSEIKDLTHNLLNEAKAKRVKLETELPASLVQLTEQVEYGRQFKEAFELYFEKQRTEEELQKHLDIRGRWKSFILAVTSRFAEAEGALSEMKIAGIDSDYKSMFGEIMQAGDIVPDLQRADGREDLHVQLRDFHGQHRLSARALLSESYRNALAISVFLAAALKHSGKPRFVVLDDVTSSFDAGHQFFLMELIRKNLQYPERTDGLQFIILSHDGLLEKYFDRIGGMSGWNHNKLQGSPPMGSVSSQAQGADRLKTTINTLLSAGQISQAEHLIRQYLEYKLQQIIRKVDIPVPIDFAIKDSSKMVSNCFEAISNAVHLHVQAGNIVLDQQQVQNLDRVHVPAIIGNWVTHYETGSGNNLSALVLAGVINSIDALAECFRYDDNANGTVTRKWYKSLTSR